MEAHTEWYLPHPAIIGVRVHSLKTTLRNGKRGVSCRNTSKLFFLRFYLFTYERPEPRHSTSVRLYKLREDNDTYIYSLLLPSSLELENNKYVRDQNNSDWNS